MSSEINNSTQISSEEPAVNTTTIKFFINCGRQAAVAYEYNPSEHINFWDRKDPGSVPCRGQLFVVVFLFKCQSTIRKDPGSTPCRGELFGF